MVSMIRLHIWGGHRHEFTTKWCQNAEYAFAPEGLSGLSSLVTYAIATLAEP